MMPSITGAGGAVGGTSEPERGARFECNICGRTFSNVYNLKVHVRDQHSGLGTIKCDVCGVALKNLSTLRVHKSNYHVRCQVCGEYFKTMDLLTQHKLARHSQGSEGNNSNTSYVSSSAQVLFTASGNAASWYFWTVVMPLLLLFVELTSSEQNENPVWWVFSLRAFMSQIYSCLVYSTHTQCAIYFKVQHQNGINEN